jgi:hypothetical protein
MKRRILNFGHFLLENTKPTVINEDLNISAIPSSELQAIIDTDMKTYLKKVMWNKSIEVFYGKDYKGNPTEDKGEIYTGAWFSGHDKVSMGEFFLDAWAETNQFCDRVVELVETGEISDTWKATGETLFWGAVGAGVVAGLVFTGGGLLGVGAAAAGATGAFTAGGTAAMATGFGISSTIFGGLGTVIWNVKGQLDEEEFKKLSPETVNVLNMINDKEGTIKKFKSEIESHSDFEADWGLDRWLPAIQGMPGWSKSSWAKNGAENIGYSFTYWISYYAYQYLQAKFGASVAMAAKESQTKQTTQPTQPVQSTQAKTEPTQTKTEPTQTKSTTSDANTTTAPSGGVMGSAKAKEYNIVVDDSTVANYDL